MTLTTGLRINSTHSSEFNFIGPKCYRAPNTWADPTTIKSTGKKCAKFHSNRPLFPKRRLMGPNLKGKNTS